MELRRSPTLEIGEKIKAAQKANKKLYSLSTPSLPYYTDTLKTDCSWGRLSPPAGLPELIDQTKIDLFAGWDVLNHQVVITAGAKASLFAILKSITKAQDKILVPSPSWPSYFDICALAECVPVEMPTAFSNGFNLEIEEIKQIYHKEKFRVIMFSNPNNPTGIIYDGDFLKQLDKFAQDCGFYVVIDQSFSKVIFDHDKWSKSRFHNSDRVIIVDSFSKNYLLQGARVAATLVPTHVTENFINIHQTILSAAPAPAQIMALQALKKKLLIPSLSKQREKTQHFLTEKKWEFIEQSGSFYFFPKILDMEVMERRAYRKDILLLKGSFFGKGYNDHFRLCFAKPMSELQIIFDKLDSALNEK